VPNFGVNNPTTPQRADDEVLGRGVEGCDAMRLLFFTLSQIPLTLSHQSLSFSHSHSRPSLLSLSPMGVSISPSLPQSIYFLHMEGLAAISTRHHTTRHHSTRHLLPSHVQGGGVFHFLLLLTVSFLALAPSLTHQHHLPIIMCGLISWTGSRSRICE
jgi:hypothetical protein